METLSTVNLIGIILFAMVGFLLVLMVLGPIFDEIGKDIKSGKCNHFVYGVIRRKKTISTTSGRKIYYVIIDAGSEPEAYPVTKRMYKHAIPGSLTEIGIKDGKVQYLRWKSSASCFFSAQK